MTTVTVKTEIKINLPNSTFFALDEAKEQDNQTELDRQHVKDGTSSPPKQNGTDQDKKETQKGARHTQIHN